MENHRQGRHESRTIRAGGQAVIIPDPALLLLSEPVEKSREYVGRGTQAFIGMMRTLALENCGESTGEQH